MVVGKHFQIAFQRHGTNFSAISNKWLPLGLGSCQHEVLMLWGKNFIFFPNSTGQKVVFLGVVLHSVLFWGGTFSQTLWKTHVLRIAITSVRSCYTTVDVYPTRLL